MATTLTVLTHREKNAKKNAQKSAKKIPGLSPKHFFYREKNQNTFFMKWGNNPYNPYNPYNPKK